MQQLPRGSNSQERDAQEEREKSSLEVLYVNANQVPDTPAEPTSQIPIEQVDAEAKTMMAGSEIQPFFASAMSVSQLVGQLKGADVGAGQGGAEQQQGFPSTMDMGSFNAPDVQMVMQSLMGSSASNAVIPPTDGNNAAQFDLRQLGLDPSALSSLTSLLGGSTAAATATNGTNPNPLFGSMYPDTGNAGTSNGYLPGFGDEYGSGPSNYGDRPRGDRDREESSGRGRRGRGRGAGGMDGYRSKRKAAPCMFFQQGRRASIPFLTKVTVRVHTKEAMELNEILSFFSSQKSPAAGVIFCLLADVNLATRVTSVMILRIETVGAVRRDILIELGRGKGVRMRTAWL